MLALLRARLPRLARHLLWLPAAVFTADHIGSVHTVTGRSMAPALSPDSRRDYIFAWRWRPADAIARGAVVLFRSPAAPETAVVKRVVALEGDVVRPRGERGERVRVPKGQVWVEGDEAFHSLDSNNYGPIPVALVEARVRAVVWPLDRIRAVGADEGAVRPRALARRTVHETMMQELQYPGRHA